MWGKDFSVYSRIVLENCIFWYRIRVLGAYSSAPNPKTIKALPPHPPGSKKQTQYNNYWCNPTTSLPHPRVVALKNIFFLGGGGGGKTQIIKVAQIEISDYYNTQKGKLK